MTLTSHGHHIPGTVDTDEPEERNRARCGGPKLCDKCKTEACQALPDDSIAKASILDDLNALVVKKEPLKVTKFRKMGPQAEVMFFTGDVEEAPNIIRWLKSHGIPASLQEEVNETLYSDYAEPKVIHVPPRIVIGNGHDGRKAVYIEAVPDSAIIHYDGDNNMIDVIASRHFQGAWEVCTIQDPAADIVQVEVKK